MKLLKRMSLLVLCTCTLLSGCIGEDTDSCPPETETSVLLAFSYPDFARCITGVTVAIYNAERMLVEHRQVDQNSLDDFAGISLNLTAGSYTAVCWGNAFDNTSIQGMTVGSPLSQHKLAQPCYFDSSGDFQTNDPLFYGSHLFTVLADTDTHNQETVHFTPAHVRLIIQVEGLLTQGQRTSDYPYIRVNNLAPAYDHTMTAQGSLTTYHPPVTINADNTLAEAVCDVLRFETVNPITIDVADNNIDKNILHTVNLQSFMEENNITIPAGKEVTIPIKVSFNQGIGVVVTLIKNWDESPSTVVPQN